MRIGLNLLPFLPGIGGTWNYVGNLLAALAGHDAENEYVAFVTRDADELVPDVPRFSRVRLSLRATRRSVRIAYENTLFRRVVANARLDCAHHLFGTLPFGLTVPSVVTVYDLMVLERPRDFAFMKRQYLRTMARRTAARATVLAPVSNTTAEHIHQSLGVSYERMQVVPAAIAEDFVPLSGQPVEDFRQRYDLPPEFWLFVSGPYPHKNHQTLIDAFVSLRLRAPNGWPLVIRGELPAEVQDALPGSVASGRVVQLARLSDDEMPLLYSAASALVFPSLFEGAGQPVMEAMACGCPVVASRIPTTREFASGVALTFDPTSIESLSAAMEHCERSETLRAELSAAGLKAVTALRPATAASACLEAYRRAAVR